MDPLFTLSELSLARQDAALSTDTFLPYGMLHVERELRAIILPSLKTLQVVFFIYFCLFR